MQMKGFHGISGCHDLRKKMRWIGDVSQNLREKKWPMGWVALRCTVIHWFHWVTGCFWLPGSIGVDTSSENLPFCPGLSDGFEIRRTATNRQEIRWLALLIRCSSFRHTSAILVIRIKVWFQVFAAFLLRSSWWVFLEVLALSSSDLDELVEMLATRLASVANSLRASSW